MQKENLIVRWADLSSAQKVRRELSTAETQYVLLVRLRCTVKHCLHTLDMNGQQRQQQNAKSRAKFCILQLRMWSVLSRCVKITQCVQRTHYLTASNVQNREAPTRWASPLRLGELEFLPFTLATLSIRCCKVLFYVQQHSTIITVQHCPTALSYTCYCNNILLQYYTHRQYLCWRYPSWGHMYTWCHLPAMLQIALLDCLALWAENSQETPQSSRSPFCNQG